MKVSQLAFKFVHSHLNGEPLDADRHCSIRSLLLTMVVPGLVWPKWLMLRKDNGAEKANITFKVSSIEQGFNVFVVAREHLTSTKQEYY